MIEVGDDSVDRNPTRTGKLASLSDRLFGNVDRIDGESLLRQIDRVASLPHRQIERPSLSKSWKLLHQKGDRFFPIVFFNLFENQRVAHVIPFDREYKPVRPDRQGDPIAFDSPKGI